LSIKGTSEPRVRQAVHLQPFTGLVGLCSQALSNVPTRQQDRLLQACFFVFFYPFLGIRRSVEPTRSPLLTFGVEPLKALSLFLLPPPDKCRGWGPSSRSLPDWHIRCRILLLDGRFVLTSLGTVHNLCPFRDAVQKFPSLIPRHFSRPCFTTPSFVFASRCFSYFVLF